MIRMHSGGALKNQINEKAGRSQENLSLKCFMDLWDGKVHVYDTLWVKKEDIPHFESIDCNAKYFHRLTSVRNTTNSIDSVVIKNDYVDFNNTTVHVYVYKKSAL